MSGACPRTGSAAPLRPALPVWRGNRTPRSHSRSVTELPTVQLRASTNGPRWSTWPPMPPSPSGARSHLSRFRGSATRNGGSPDRAERARAVEARRPGGSWWTPGPPPPPTCGHRGQHGHSIHLPPLCLAEDARNKTDAALVKWICEGLDDEDTRCGTCGPTRQWHLANGGLDPDRPPV